MDALGALRVVLPQNRHDGVDALLPGQGLQLLPAAGFGEGGKAAAGHQAVHIQPRAAGNDAGLAAGQNVLQNRVGHVHIAADGEGLRRIGHVDHMVGHAPHFLGGGLGGAHVHAPVELHGVAGQHLAVQGQSQLHGQPGFPGRRGPDHADDVLIHGNLLMAFPGALVPPA